MRDYRGRNTEQRAIAKEKVSSQRRDDGGISDERLTSGVTGDDVCTIAEICVALMIVSASLAAAHILALGCSFC
jgi:hypothetical protein